MSTDFQKDLYKKSGSLLTTWDICIGVGLIAFGSGAYIHFKDKKQQKSVETLPKKSLGMGSANNIALERTANPIESGVKKRRKPNKPEISEEKLDTLSKLGL